MCGVLGFLTDIPSKENLKLFRRALYMSESRGKDATGIAIVQDGNIVIDKAPIVASQYITNVLPKFEEQIAKSNIVLGHTRNATMGKPSDNNNNHPIQSENWVMIHNGMCPSLEKIKDYKYMGDVDSELYLAYIETKGLYEGLPEIRSSSATVVLINKKNPNKVYFYKNSQPLYFAYDSVSQTLFFASTDDILEAALANKMSIFTTFQIRKACENYLYEVTINPLNLEITKKLEPKKAFTTYYPGYGRGGCSPMYGGRFQEEDWWEQDREVAGTSSQILSQLPGPGVVNKSIAAISKDVKSEQTGITPPPDKEKIVSSKILRWDNKAKWWEVVTGKKVGEPNTPVFSNIGEVCDEYLEIVDLVVFLDKNNDLIGYSLRKKSIKEVEGDANEEG